MRVHHHLSMESSPRFRSTDSDTPSPPPPTKLRLMCSTGGHILPRPHDKSLCYIGGDTRIVSVDRHTTLQDLTHRLNKTLFKSLPTSSFTLKYQLPSEDLDALISVTTDEDLENMIDEYERLNSSSRIRLFVFPSNPDSGSTVSSIGSFLENPSKSEDWFMNALNGTVSGMSDTSSVNCLLDLDGEIVEKKDVSHKRNVFSFTNVVNNSGQDVYSVPDSGQETTSSFGSASSHGNLLTNSVQKGQNKDHEDGGLVGLSAPVVVSGSPVSSATVIREESDPFLLYHERLEPGLDMGYVKHHQQQSTGFDLSSMDSILSDLTINDQSSPVSQIQSSSSNNLAANPTETHDLNTRIHILQQQQNAHNPAYLMPMPTTQQQPQYIPPPLQYIHHHHHPPVAVPVTSFYQHHPHPHHPPMDQQNFMYYIPTRQPPQGYNFPLQQVDTPPAAAIKPESAAGVYRTTSAGAPQLVRVPSGYHNQLQHVGYSEIHQPTQSVYYAAPLLNAQYQKMTSVSAVEAGLQEQQMRSAQP
ncbi:putative PB1 domain-containing protein [Helianthus annuus]|nr:putative PB1 domain-containing protein [Helianthus annuus]